MRALKYLFLLAAVCAQAATSVSQYGITWTFSEDHTVGQYANGDYYVVENSPGAGVTITDIDPASTYTPTNSSVVTITNASPCVVSWTAHGMRPGQLIRFSTTGSLPTGLTAGAWYYVSGTSFTANSFKVSTIPWPANVNVNTTSSGSGVQTCEYGRVINGTMINPVAGIGVFNGFDSSLTLNKGSSAVFSYAEDLNYARPNGADLSVGNPLVADAGSSLISSISYATAQNRPQLSDAAVLTVVAAAPAANSMRPPYCGTDKSHNWNADDMDYDILLSLVPVPGTPTLSSVSDLFTRPWIEIETYVTGREMHPYNNQPIYGRDMAHAVGNAAMSLLLNYTNEQKEMLYIRLCQYGLDVYGAAVTGGYWQVNGGHNLGRKEALMRAGQAWNDPAILAYADKEQHDIFQEDQATFYVAQDDVDITHSDAWTPNTAESARTVTISNSSPAIVTKTDHGLTVGSKTTYTSSGTLPTGIVAGTNYYVLATGLTDDQYQLSLTRGGAAINTTSSGSGTITERYAIPYTVADIGVPDWGPSLDPDDRNFAWSATYRAINYGAFLAPALVSHLLNETAAWNWAPFFDYQDRVMTIETTVQSDISKFELNMWQTYRNGPPTDPFLSSAVIATDGADISLVFNESCTTGLGGAGGVTLSASGGAVTASYASGSGSTTYVYNLSRTLLSGEVVSVSYVQPGNGIQATVGGADVASFSDLAVENDSTQIVVEGAVPMKKRLGPQIGF